MNTVLDTESLQLFHAVQQEQQRLEALHSYQILDTPPEDAFDHITRLAARFFRVPMALVTLIDRDRARFKSCYGVSAELRDTERSQSFCGQAIGSSEVFVVPDASQDPFFANSPLVTGGLKLRFYAGAPLIHPSGVRLGTLCILDTQPRPPLEPEERATLKDLAAMVMDRLGMRLAALEMEASETRYRFLVDAIPQLVWTARPDGGLDYVNQRSLEFLNCTFAQLTEWGWQDVLHPEDLQLCLKHWRNSLATGEPYEIEFRMRASDGEYRWHLAKALPFRDEDGKILKWFGTTTDIAETKRTEVALQVARIEAERANRAKDEFLSRMSHELRTPLNAILGFSYLLEKSELDPQQHKNVGYIHRSGHHLLELINEVLDVSSIEAGRLAFSLEAFSLSNLTLECLNMMGAQAEKAGVQLPEFEDGPYTVQADRKRLKQVLLNLLSNAVKYNLPGGSVTLSCEFLQPERPQPEHNLSEMNQKRSSAPKWLRFSVTDTGMGLKPHLLERMFIPFDRLGAEQTNIEGTGLGLALSKRLVEGMGGRLGVSSEVGVGSTFWLELPVALESEAVVSYRLSVIA